MALAYERLAEKYAKRIQLLEDKAQATRDRRRRGWKPKIRREPAAEPPQQAAQYCL